MSNPNWVPTPPGSAFQDSGNVFSSISSTDNCADPSSALPPMTAPPDDVLEKIPTPDNCASSSSAPPPPDNEPPLPLLPAAPEEFSSFSDELELELPPGFRFRPTDLELLSYYLRRKISKKPVHTKKIQDTNIYKCNPDFLTESFKEYGDNDEWYFFTSRGKKYRNGKKPNRETEDKFGFWKATGEDKPCPNRAGQVIGRKRSLAYYLGQAKIKESLVKTHWLMHEFVLTSNPDTPSTSSSSPPDPATMELDEVICRIYKKKPAKGKGRDSEIIAQEEERGVADSTQAQQIEENQIHQQENAIIQPEQNAIENLHMPQQTFPHNPQNQTIYQYLAQKKQLQEPSQISYLGNGNANESSQFCLPQQMQNHPHLIHPENNYMAQHLQDALDYQSLQNFSLVNDNQYFYNNVIQQQQAGIGLSTGTIDYNQQNVSGPGDVHFSNVSSMPYNGFNNTDSGHEYDCPCFDCFTRSGSSGLAAADTPVSNVSNTTLRFQVRTGKRKFDDI